MLRGEAQITYTNNSPDTLQKIVFHSYPDYYKPGARKDPNESTYNPALESEGMVIDHIEVAKKKVDAQDETHLSHRGTYYTIHLKEPLLPKSALSIGIGWHYTIPGEGFERSGAVDSTSMLVAYWYPEIAVYDDVDGWDQIIYDSSVEFYHDYSDYDVELEVPDNFLVWASVPPSNEPEVYSSGIRERLKKAAGSTVPVTIVSAQEFNTTPSGKLKRWKYQASNFPDFSFALSDHFIWESATYTDANGTYVLNSAYPPQNVPFAASLPGAQASLKIFHTDFPAYPFPNRYFTLFNGEVQGGMEFPGMANNMSINGEWFSKVTGTKITDYEANLALVLHEMSHMYFPFLMGTHEKKYAWMDEGAASFAGFFLNRKDEYGIDLPGFASQSVTPMMTPSYTQPLVHSINSYSLGAYSFHALYHLLGKDLYQKCLREYINRWKYKHPTPYDYMNTFNEVSGQDLNWFWKRWYFDWGYPDIGIKTFENNQLSVENLGGRPLSFRIEYTYSDGTTAADEVSAGVWKEADLYVKKLDTVKEVTAIRLANLFTGDTDTVKSNNSWKK